MQPEIVISKNAKIQSSSARKRRTLGTPFLRGVALAAMVASACAVEVSTDDGEAIDRTSSALSADDCRDGNGCTSPTWTYDVTPQWPSDWGEGTYCVGRKCKKGEGDCDSNSECEAGLSCVSNRGAFVGLPADFEICWPTDHVCKQLGPCRDGEGDCDSFPGEQGPRQCVEGTYCKEEGTVDKCRTRTPDDLDSYLAGETVSAPAFGAAVFDDDGMIAIGVRGVRKFGETTLMKKSDRWHLGSNTKAMTATLAAVLEWKGKVNWELGDSWHTKHADYEGGRSLYEILGHRGGFIRDLSVPITGSWRSQREALATLAWSTAPAIDPGEDLYSNVGYVVAADIMEHDANDTYENLLLEYLWKPLGMGCVFNYPSAVWGHYLQRGTLPGGIPTVTIVPSQGDNDPYYLPAGRAQCSLEDYGKFLREHLRGPADKSALLPAAFYSAMHRDPGDALGNYQAGWIIGDYKGDLRLTHDGSNRLNYVTTTVVPGRNIAVVVVANMAEDLFGAIPGQVATVREELLTRYRP